jgi:hypothetical protein
MKNIKKQLSMGVALTLALFVSLQTSGMDQELKINPYLEDTVLLARLIETYKQQADPKNRHFGTNGLYSSSPEERNKEAKKLALAEKIFYDYRPYSYEKIQELLDY